MDLSVILGVDLTACANRVVRQLKAKDDGALSLSEDECQEQHKMSIDGTWLLLQYESI